MSNDPTTAENEDRPVYRRAGSGVSGPAARRRKSQRAFAVLAVLAIVAGFVIVLLYASVSLWFGGGDIRAGVAKGASVATMP